MERARHQYSSDGRPSTGRTSAMSFRSLNFEVEDRNGLTPLILVLDKGHPALVRYLIQGGARCLQRTSTKLTACNMAQVNCHARILGSQASSEMTIAIRWVSCTISISSPKSGERSRSGNRVRRM
jgi:hypothetical protein